MKKLPKVDMDTFLAYRRELQIDGKKHNPTLLRTTFDRLQREYPVLAEYIWNTAYTIPYHQPLTFSDEKIERGSKALATGLGVFLLLERSLGR